MQTIRDFFRFAGCLALSLTTGWGVFHWLGAQRALPADVALSVAHRTLDAYRQQHHLPPEAVRLVSMDAPVAGLDWQFGFETANGQALRVAVSERGAARRLE